MPRTPKRKPAPPSTDPYPSHSSPTPSQSLADRDALLLHHGFPSHFAPYRRSSPTPTTETVLDGLINTILSQNTTDRNSHKAFANLKSAFPEWDQAVDARVGEIEDAIRCGGLAVTKAARIKSILTAVREKRGEVCLEYLRDLSVEEVKDQLMHFKGIGPKTVACVLMFQLQRDDFPVDTHVFRITKAIGWVPEKADREKAYHHLNKRIPDELKFDLNCLLVTHGKLCQRCTKKGGKQQTLKAKIVGEETDGSHVACPLTSYSRTEDKHDS